MKTLQQIINEADLLVPNVVLAADKVSKLNSINADFFNVVKIPQFHNLTAVKSQPQYAIGPHVKAKDIDSVSFGMFNYKNAMILQPKINENYFTYDDNTNTLIVVKPPYRDGIGGFIRYFKSATTTFTPANLTVKSDVPAEYHWTLVPALASWLALSQDDGVKASMFEAQYKTAWNVAAQNYLRGDGS